MSDPIQKDLGLARTTALHDRTLVLFLCAPIIGLTLIFAVATPWIMFQSANGIDAVQAKGERTLARTSLNSVTDPIQKTLVDYSVWEEMYDQTKGKIDINWTKENLGPYLNKTFWISHILILSGDGTPKYAFISGSNSSLEYANNDKTPLSARDLSTLSAYSKAVLNEALNGGDRGLSGTISFQGTPHFVAINAIQVDAIERKQHDKPFLVMVFLKSLDDALMQSLATKFELERLSIAEGIGLPLFTPLGSASPYVIQWVHKSASKSFIGSTIAMLCFLATLWVLFTALLVVSWKRMFQKVRAAEVASLDERARSIQETARAKSMFIANMSHELRTPLNAIIGFSDMTQKEMLGPHTVPKYREYSEYIYGSAMHLLGIVNNILTLSKIEAQQQKLKIEPINLQISLAETFRMIGPDSDKRNVRIDAEPFGALPPVIADKQAVTQILVNLLSNGINFSKVNGVVRVLISKNMQRQTVSVRVVDEGCGMAALTLAQLGKPFVQAEDPFSRNFQGTGLGLSICFALARELQATLEIDSIEGSGTTATLTLPMAVEQIMDVTVAA